MNKSTQIFSISRKCGMEKNEGIKESKRSAGGKKRNARLNNVFDCLKINIDEHFTSVLE